MVIQYFPFSLLTVDFERGDVDPDLGEDGESLPPAGVPDAVAVVVPGAVEWAGAGLDEAEAVDLGVVLLLAPWQRHVLSGHEGVHAVAEHGHVLPRKQDGILPVHGDPRASLHVQAAPVATCSKK